MIAAESRPFEVFGDRTVRRAWREGWTPRPRPKRSDWCEQSIRLPGDRSAQPGPYSFSGREYLREIIDAVDDPTVAEIVIPGGTQVGKTELIRAVIASQGEVDAAPMMLAGPDQVYTREQREYVYKLCESSPALRDRIPPERLRNDRCIDLGKAYVYLAWSGSTQRLSGRSCKIVCCSEVDRWQSSLHLARQRVKAFWRSCVIFEGSPIGESPELQPRWESSDQRTYRVPCPHCGRYQELRFFPHTDGPYKGKGGMIGLRDDAGRWRTPAEARKHAVYLCENGCLIESKEKASMIAKGVWAPAGCEAIEGQVIGEPHNPGRRRGYRLPSILSPTVSFGDMAEEWMSVRDSEEGKQSFFNDWLALPYVNRGRVPKWSILGERLRSSNPLGYVPAPALFLTAGCDVQEHETYYAVRAWGEGSTSWLVERGRCDVKHEPDGSIDAESHLRQLEAVFAKEWPVIGTNPVGLTKLGLARAAVDCGYKTRMVHNWLRGLRDRRFVLTLGSHQIQGLPYRHSVVERNTRTGKPYPGGLRYWGINVSLYKGDIQDRWSMKPTDPGAWFLPNAPIEELEDYLRQLTNEVRRIEVNQKTKHSKEIWVIVDEHLGNHYFDCEVYAAAMADQVVERRWENIAPRFAPTSGGRQPVDRKRGFIRRSGGGFLGRKGG